MGTKLKIAFMADKHDTVGLDLVAYCVNDNICQGRSPCSFWDYLAVELDRKSCSDRGGGSPKDAGRQAAL